MNVRMYVAMFEANRTLKINLDATAELYEVNVSLCAILDTSPTSPRHTVWTRPLVRMYVLGPMY